ncbi:hypothetical protein JVU11DRAFT_8369 [Chiua virens]|nr:hypothetical protein JVU11DRAFT_8369 [Chiua virens]
MQKAEKHREEQNLSNSTAAGDHCDVQGEAPTASSPHMRVWWKKSPPNSTNNSSAAILELNGQLAAPCAAGRSHRGTLKLNDSPSARSSRLSPVHHTWPSIDSTAMPISETSPRGAYARRPSVASITRKLSFINFGRRPSVPDVTEPLPTPPPSATLTELAPSAVLQGVTTRASNICLACRRSDAVTSPQPVQQLANSDPAASHPSLSIAGGPPPLPPVVKASLPRRPDVTDSPKSGILKSRTSPNASAQSSPHTPHSTSIDVDVDVESHAPAPAPSDTVQRARRGCAEAPDARSACDTRGEADAEHAQAATSSEHSDVTTQAESVGDASRRRGRGLVGHDYFLFLGGRAVYGIRRSCLL